MRISFVLPITGGSKFQTTKICDIPLITSYRKVMASQHDQGLSAEADKGLIISALNGGVVVESQTLEKLRYACNHHYQ
jgi:hypothetical protein